MHVLIERNKRRRRWGRSLKKLWHIMRIHQISALVPMQHSEVLLIFLWINYARNVKKSSSYGSADFWENAITSSPNRRKSGHRWRLYRLIFFCHYLVIIYFIKNGTIAQKNMKHPNISFILIIFVFIIHCILLGRVPRKLQKHKHTSDKKYRK